MRIEAGILYVLNQFADEGHVYYPYGLLVSKCGEILEVEDVSIPVALTHLVEEKKIFIEQPRTLRFNTGAPATRGQEQASPDTAVYLARFYVSEAGIARQMKTLLTFPKQLRLMNVDDSAMGCRKS
jgi:exodeoxyribonuclease V alpha subunit